MRQRLIFPLKCPALRETVELQTRLWKVEPDGANEVIHYWGALCACGSEHLGSLTLAGHSVSNQVASS